MEASGKVHPLSAPVGGLRWKQEAQERFPDLARTAGVFPYMGDVIEREALDTPYDYAPPPEIDSEVAGRNPSETSQQAQAQQEEPVDIFALGLVEEGVRVQNPVVCVRGQGSLPQVVPMPSGGFQADRADGMRPFHVAAVAAVAHGMAALAAPGGVSRGALASAPSLLGNTREGTRERSRPLILLGSSPTIRWLSPESLFLSGYPRLFLAAPSLALHLRFIGSNAMRHAALRVVSASASKVSRRKPDLTSKSRNALSSGIIPATIPQILSSRAIGDARLDSFQEAAPPFAPIASRFAAADAVVPLATSERRGRIPAVPFAARSYVSGTGRTAAPAASAPAGSPLASAASANRASSPGSDKAGSERRGWNLLFGGGGEEREGQGAGGRGGGAAAEAEGKGESGGGWLSRFQTFLRLGKGGAGKAGEKKRLTHAEGLTEFANQLKRARQFGQLTTFGKSLPKGGQSVVTNSLRKQEVITLALAAYAAEAKLADERLSIPFSVRQRVASETGSTMGEIDMLLAKYEWFAEAANRMQALQDEGKPLPRSFAEIEQMMGGPWSPPKKGAGSGASSGSAGGAGSAAAAPARNSPCPCGSGKRYKRCCGAGTK
ncbi:unnamed protein product [Closterium sp. Yama58-4]|nr:unnamed protein product [Closterium sp. Yama58-4]